MMRDKNIELLKKYNVLYIEDNKEISEEMAFFLEPRFASFFCAYDGKEGLKLFKEHRPDLVITDIQMPIMNGLEMIEYIREIDGEMPIIITTAFNESSYLLKAINLNIDAYVMKPLNIKELIEKLFKVIEPLELKRQLILKNKELQEINENLENIAKEKTKELEYLYNHDQLTGLSNFISLGEEIQSQEYKYLLLLDISNFSSINKQYGKEFSNKILQKVADRLKDNTNTQKRLFKTESDRFVILCKKNDAKEVKEFANQIISFFDTQKMLIEDLEVSINFTIGIALINKDFFPLVNAEYALDIAKDIGSRYYHFYDSDAKSIEKAKENIKWLNATKEMLENDQIVPYFQPIMDIQTGKILKYEVLARGEFQGEAVYPYVFIQQAEHLGLLSSITKMMINKSFHYFQDKEINFSLNITKRDILDKQFIDFLKEKISRYKIDPSRVSLELLESVTLGNNNILIASNIKTLKAMGFQLAIDDFGVKNSNFSRLIEMDFDCIKIDGVFMKDLVDNKKNQRVLMAIVNLADTLGMKTIAEFVENEALYEVVKECGVSMAQGYYVGKPLENIIV